eukprot:NODE_891_length_1390_cov_99.448173_g727_i1.p2 GENE.NODE_891_length_1390_cov_99.448173_g727_i1~~NODE_891_length_1390_cov_99.448173_g727_i1.p2  ORF type:complete len:137 (+),score=37.11 NODE_891_length_1390_cov_99.448173_g727_i1:744-1154(+)
MSYGFHRDSDSEVGRMATFLMYLTDVEDGGETIFPGVSRKVRTGLPPLNFFEKKHPDMRPYCNSEKVFKVKAKRGRAVFFFNHLPDLQIDSYSLHGACPIKAGNKTIAQRWIKFYKASEGNMFYRHFFQNERQPLF